MSEDPGPREGASIPDAAPGDGDGVRYLSESDVKQTKTSRRANGENGPAATIQSVERAAAILSFFTVTRPRLTLSEMTARLGVSKATAHRYAMALRRVGLLRYDKSLADYTLGPQVLTLATVARAGLPIITTAGPFMEQIVKAVNETSVLSVWDGDAPVVVRVDDSTERVVRVSVRAGARLSSLESAQGKVFCAYLPADQVGEIAAEIERDPTLAAELAAIRDVGVAVNTPEIHGVRTVAAPVFSEGRIIAVLAVVGTTATVSDDISSSTAKTLKRIAQELSEQFGAHSDTDLDGALATTPR